MKQMVKQNQTERRYFDINDFEFRVGKFYDPNEHFNGSKFEIRILHKDPELLESLLEQIKEVVNN